MGRTLRGGSPGLQAGERQSPPFFLSRASGGITRAHARVKDVPPLKGLRNQWELPTQGSRPGLRIVPFFELGWWPQFPVKIIGLTQGSLDVQNRRGGFECVRHQANVTKELL